MKESLFKKRMCSGLENIFDYVQLCFISLPLQLENFNLLFMEHIFLTLVGFGCSARYWMEWKATMSFVASSIVLYVVTSLVVGKFSKAITVGAPRGFRWATN